MGHMGMGHMLAAQGMGGMGMPGLGAYPGQAAGAAGAAAAAAAAAAGGPGAQSAMSMFNLAAMGAMGMGVPGAAGSPSAVPGSASTQRQTPLTALLRLESAADSETPITEMPNSISNGCDQLKSQRTHAQQHCSQIGGAESLLLGIECRSANLLTVAPLCALTVFFSSGVEMLRALHECDAQIFSGFGGHAGLFDEPCLSAAGHLIGALGRALTARAGGESARVIVAGGGPAGRVAWQLCQSFNAVLAKQSGGAAARAGQAAAPDLFHCLIAGGDRALPFDAESEAEESAERGRADLIAAMRGQAHVVYIGISAGLSSPAVAAQIDYCMQIRGGVGAGDAKAEAAAASGRHASLHTALLGFNPTARSRDVSIEPWPAASNVSVANDGNTFRQVTRRLDAQALTDAVLGAAPTCTILTPVLGPEFITGHTRLKCCSAAGMILSSLFSVALTRSLPFSLLPALAAAASTRSALGVDPVRSAYLACLSEFEASQRQLSLALPKLAALVDRVSESLAAPAPVQLGSASASTATAAAQGGRLIYLSLSSAAGRAALSDAVEMDEAFGSGSENVRAFGLGGLRGAVRDPASLDAKSASANGAGSASAAAATSSSPSAPLDSSLTAFRDVMLRTLSPRDTVVLLAESEAAGAASTSAALKGEDAGWTTEQTVQLLQAIKGRDAKLALVAIALPPQPKPTGRGAAGSSAASAGSASASSGPALLVALEKSSLASVFDLRVSVPLVLGGGGGGLLSPAGDDGSLLSFAWKSVCNALSTCAHVSRGFTLGNCAVNLRVSSPRQFSRAVALITSLTRVGEDVAERQLLRAIYQLDSLSDEVRSAKVEAHVEKAAGLVGVLPLALLLAECEGSKHRAAALAGTAETSGAAAAAAGSSAAGSAAGASAPPAISVQQAVRQLQRDTFNKIMRAKYAPSAARGKASPSSVTAAAAAVAAAAASAMAPSMEDV
jgi:N-acetylmuramic acid 6-phosphate (MurNAc-6-P) etherase